MFLVTMTILLLSSIVATWFISREIYFLIKEYRLWIYVYSDPQHSKQHIAILVALLILWIIMTYHLLVDDDWDLVMLYYIYFYNLFVIPFMAKHFEQERNKI